MEIGCENVVWIELAENIVQYYCYVVAIGLQIILATGETVEANGKYILNLSLTWASEICRQVIGTFN